VISLTGGRPTSHPGAHAVSPALCRGINIGGVLDARSDNDRRVVLRRDLATAAEWAGARGVPLFVGEFGTYAAADRDSRVRWTTAVRTELERLGVGWCYRDFATDFGAVDPAGGTWHEPLRAALLGGTSR